jgi:hypothetical protein
MGASLDRQADSSRFAGTWTYRSFRSDPDLAASPASLLFGQGTLQLKPQASGQLTGTLGGDGWQLDLNGEFIGQDPPTVRFRGTGMIGGEQWVYDYLGYLIPTWPNGVDQRSVIVGSIVRLVPHSGGTAPAGYVAQWIAVRADGKGPGNAVIPQQMAQQELRQLENAWATAVGTNDAVKIGRFFPERFLFVGAGGVLQNRDEHLDDFRSGRLKVDSVTVMDVTAEVYEEFAITSTLTAVKGKLGNRDISGNYRFMDTWRKKDGQWFAVARQQTRVAVPPPLDTVPSIRTETPYNKLLREMYLKQDTHAVAPAMRSLLLNARSSSPTPGSLKPESIRSANGRLDATLEVGYTTVHIGLDDVKLRTYNGKLVGPVLRAKAGDTLYITLINKLPLDPQAPPTDNGHHEWNTTNLHFHGLHVAPQGPTVDQESDNVLLSLRPTTDPSGSVQKYAVKIPDNHVAGTFWYHAHRHGSVAAQVSSGMAGALIIERNDSSHNLDSVPEVAAAAEEIMVLQQIPYLRNDPSVPGAIELSPETDPQPNQAVMFGPGQWPTLKRFVTVNGERIPTITVAPAR